MALVQAVQYVQTMQVSFAGKKKAQAKAEVHFSTLCSLRGGLVEKVSGGSLCWLGLGLSGRGRNIEILLVFGKMREGIWNLELELELRDGSCVESGFGACL